MRYCFILLLQGLLLDLSAQQLLTQTLKGQVIDQDVRYELIGANVAIYQDANFIQGGKTNEKGEFKLEGIPVGRYKVVVSYVGYIEKTFQNIEINSGKQTQLFVELKSASTKMKDIVVSTKKGTINNSMATVSARNFNPEEASRYVASREDIGRMATNFAGVRGSDDSRNDMVIRGNTPNGVIWRIEGFDVSNPNHFASFGSTGGPVNIINNKLLGNSDFMTGAFPADYGNGISGVFDLRLRNGNKEKHEFTAQVGILGLEATAEGPLHKKSGASYTFSYRYATLAIMNKLGINFGTAGNPSYQDFNAKLNFPIRKVGQLSFFALGGKSDIAILDNGEDSAKWTFGRAGRDIHFGSRFGLAGLIFQQNISKKTFHRISLGVNLNRSYSRYDTIAPDRITRGATYRNQFTVDKGMLNYSITHRLNAANVIKGGFILTQLHLDLLDSNYYPDQNIWYNEADFNSHTQQIQSYIAWQFEPSNPIKVNVGFHYFRLLLNGSQSLEPRLGISYAVSSKMNVNFGYGLHSNLQPYYLYFVRSRDSSGNDIVPNTNIGLNKSHHFVVGADYVFSPGLRGKVEVYYQRLFNIPSEVKGSAYTPLNQGATFNFVFPGKLANTGQGYNTGIDFTLEKFFSSQFYFLTTASIYRSRYKASDDVWRHTEFDGQFNFNLLSGKEFTVGKARTAKIITGFKFNIAGGKWYTPIDSARSAQKRQYEGIDSLTNTKQFPFYHRLDLRLGFRKNLKRYTHHFYIDLINAYNKQNVLGLTYIPKTGEVVEEKNLGFLPLFNWLIEF